MKICHDISCGLKEVYIYSVKQAQQRKSTPLGWTFFADGAGDLKGRPERSEGKKVSGGHFFSPWENPSLSGCGPSACKRKARMIENEHRRSRRRPHHNFTPPEGRKM